MRSNSEDRTTFDYQNLLSDIRKIRSGITHHLTVPMEPVIPSDIDALSTNYTDHKKWHQHKLQLLKKAPVLFLLQVISYLLYRPLALRWCLFMSRGYALEHTTIMEKDT